MVTYSAMRSAKNSLHGVWKAFDDATFGPKNTLNLRESLPSVAEARRYALSQPIASLVVGIDSERVLDQDLELARTFVPMSAAEMTALENRVKPVASDGRFEPHKSTQNYDGPYHREQHGFAV